MRTFFAITAAMTITGCASIVGSKVQTVSVGAVPDNSEVAGVGCTLTNDVGQWTLVTPGAVLIQKSAEDLAVECKRDTTGVGLEMVASKANTLMWGNLLMGGPVGYAVDRQRGAGFDYPNSITVVLKKLQETLEKAVKVATKAPVQPATTTAAATAAAPAVYVDKPMEAPKPLSEPERAMKPLPKMQSRWE